MKHPTLLIILLFLFAGCRHSDVLDQDKEVFRYNEAANITSLDPAFSRDQANIWATNQIFNGLVQLNDKLEILPCIARYWEISKDGKEYTFHLRGDVIFHDSQAFPGGKGRRVNAGDFCFSFNRVTDRATASPGSWVFNSVYRKNDSCAFKAVDDTTLVIRLKQSFPPFLGLLTTLYCSVVPYEAVKYYGQEFGRNPVGTGPFYFKMWKEGVKLVLLKNPAYFEMENGARLPYIDAVAITFLSDKQSAFLEFIKGRLDFISGIDASYKDELLTRNGTLNPKFSGKIKLITQDYLNTEYFGFMMSPTPIKSDQEPVRIQKLRQAVNYAFDRKKMVEFLRNNIGVPGTGGIIPPGLPSFDTTCIYYYYDLKKAKQLLIDAGYKNTEEMPEITLSTTSDYLDICKYIQHQVEEIGIRIKIEVIPPAALKEMKSQAKLPFFRASWIADYPDAENYLSLFYSKNFSPEGPNYTHFSDRKFDALYETAMATINDSLRYSIYREMDKLIMQSAPVVILYYDQVLRFVHKNVEGLGCDPMNMLKLKRVWKPQP
jgi:ABC-type transport system substrate-binding protein